MQRETVWLVEDEQGIADTLVYMLQQEGFAVEVFERGLPVLDKARQLVPDVMILDVGLPDISGFELCRQLLALHPALPVLFLTARSEEVDRLLGLEIGADDYVAKPRRKCIAGRAGERSEHQPPCRGSACPGEQRRDRSRDLSGSGLCEEETDQRRKGEAAGSDR